MLACRQGLTKTVIISAKKFKRFYKTSSSLKESTKMDKYVSEEKNENA